MPCPPMLHPKAYLTSRKNVRAGLVARSKILTVLENGQRDASHISKETALSYECVTYHLKAMKKDRLVEKMGRSRPFAWGLTRFGQQRLLPQ